MATRKRKRAVKKAAIPRNKWIKGSVKVNSNGVVKFKTTAVRKATRKRATKRRATKRRK